MLFLAAAGLVMILSGLGAYYATDRELSAFSLLNLIIGPVLLAAAGVIQVRQVRGFTGALSRRMVWRWLTITAGVLGIAVLLTALTAGWRSMIDLTIERTYTLAPQTREVCGGMSAAANGSGAELLFFEEAKLAREVELLVRAYQEACPDLRVRFLSFAEAPPSARILLDRYESTVVACRRDRCEYVGFPSEENVTNALLRLLRRSSLRAYFLVGHGEVNLADPGKGGYSALAEVLQREGIEVRGWIGPAANEVPDADLVIVAAPARNLLEPEIEALDRYLRRGGRLLVLLEPDARSNFDGLLERWGFELPDGVLADTISSPLLEEPKPVSLLINSFGRHAVVRDLDVRTMLILPGARMVHAGRKLEGGDRLRDLAYTSSGSWLESNVEAALADLPIEPDGDEPRGRELPVAAAASYPRDGHEARIVVVGDRDFVSNELIGSLYNRDFLMNSIWWLAEDERWISIRPKLWTPDHFPVTIQETLSYFYFFAFALPEVLLLLGIGAWYRQRG